MKFQSTVVVALFYCNLAYGTFAESEQPIEEDQAPMSSDTSETINVSQLPAEARVAVPQQIPVIRQNPVHAYPSPIYHQAVYQQPQPSIVPSQQPIYQPVSSYQPQIEESEGQLKHPKEHGGEKKPIPSLDKMKPDYYPKHSSYSTIPEQPKEIHHSPRFVANPNRKYGVETVSPQQLQQLTMQQPYPMMHYHQLPQHYAVQGAGGNPAYMIPFNNIQPESDAVTVKYDETEHGFIDRVWGEVVTIREAISDGFFEVIPSMFRNLWNAIVGVVSSTSARMLGSIDWIDALQLLVRQLN